jgi:XTP/dITP diphosphohydrolase
MSARHKDTLVVATTNRGKLEELRALLAGLPVEVRSVAEVLPDPPHVVEDGATFSDNAVKKAKTVAHATMMLTLADDSGLEVAALDGRPGVRSARFAHPRATDAENNAALLGALDALGDPPDPHGFRAAFRCVLALVDPFTASGEPRIVEGACEGTITRTPRGSGGFGYDPLFVVSGTDRTMAELGEDEKNRVSHRARAFAALRPMLEKVLDERAAQVARV